MPSVSKSQSTNPIGNSSNDVSTSQKSGFGPVPTEERQKVNVLGSRMMELMRQLEECKAIDEMCNRKIAELKGQ